MPATKAIAASLGLRRRQTRAGSDPELPPGTPLTAWVHLTVLWSFAFAQPLFDVLADSPEFFVARGNTRGDILILAFGVTLLPPTVLVAIEIAVWRLKRVRLGVHLVSVAVLVAATAIQVLDATAASSVVLIPGALVLGALAAGAYTRGRVAAALSMLAPAPVAFLALFLAFSPVSRLVLPQNDSSAAGAAIRNETPVVVVIFDELSGASLMDSRYRIDPVRYPNFARLARGSTWFRNATTVADETQYALPAILTGEDPDGDLLPIASDHPKNLFTLLGDRYSLHVEESVTKLCPERLCTRVQPSAESRLRSLVSDLGLVSLHLLAPGDVESGLPAVDRTFSGFGDSGGSRTAFRQSVNLGLAQNAFGSKSVGRRGDVFMDFVRGLRVDTVRPPLYFLHIQLPHTPYQFLPTGQQYAGHEIPIPSLGPWSRTPVIARLGFQRYLLQLEYVDRLLGRLLSRLRAIGLYRRSLVVITADHGVSFHPGLPRRKVTKPTFADIAGVPLFVKAPGQRSGRTVDAPVTTVDIMPTVADYLGFRLPRSVAGRSLRAHSDRGVQRLTVRSFPEPAVSVGPGEYRAERDAAVDRMIRLFGSDDAETRLYRAGPDGVLVGREADRLATASREGVEVELDEPGAFQSLNPRASGLPAFIGGRLSGDATGGKRIAIAVNGRLRAVTVSYRQDGEVRFAAMVPASSFRRGSNAIEVFEIHGKGENRRLASLGSGQVTLASRHGRTVIVSGSGKETEVIPGAVKGHVDRVTTLANRVLILAGWAADPAAPRVADRVLLFLDGRLLVDGPPTRDRPDIARIYGPRLARSGFLLAAPIAHPDKVADDAGLRIFAVAGKRASELAVPRGEAAAE